MRLYSVRLSGAAWASSIFRRVRSVSRAPWLRRGLSAAFLVAAAALIYRQIAGISVGAFVSSLAATGFAAVSMSIALTVCSYLCLAGTEWLALRLLGHRLNFRQVATVAVPAYALTNSVAFGVAAGAALRLQMYGRRGLSAGQSTAVTMLSGTAVTLSAFVTAGVVMLAAPSVFSAGVHASAWSVAVLGAILIVPAALWFVTFRRSAPRWLGGARPAVPRVRTRLLGLLVGVGDWLFSSAALFALLPNPQLANYPTFLAAYVAGTVVGAASGVPGGIGVFEAIVLTLSSVFGQVHETAAALLLYRCIYSLGPLGIFGVVAGIRRLLGARDGNSRQVRQGAERGAA
jgi:phosphatidylglycerol lysyltransferase